jgi:hypothetical protein
VTPKDHGDGGSGVWQWVIVLGILAVAIAAIVCIIVLLRRSQKPKSATPQGLSTPLATPAAAAAGWYADPNDPTLMRYFDGQVWTSSTRPGQVN